jgi:hypothetical protein
MRTVNLSKESPSVSELLAMAREKSVLLVSDDGTTYLLEEADEFDREVAVLGNSDRFMRFLKKRSKEKAVISIEEFAEELTDKMHNNQPMPPSPLPVRSRRSAVPSARKKRSPRRD